MQRFRLFLEEFLTEAKKKAVGIQHIEHPADLLFDGPKDTTRAFKTLRGIAMGRTPVTRKIDDRMSFQTIRDKKGRVGVKYKGSGSTYNFSNDDIDRQHGEKPYLVGPLKAILAHVGKVLPDRAGEYQGGFMSTPETRTEKGGSLSHTPNTVTYSVKKDSPEGKKLANSKISMVIHTELTGKNKKVKPILNQSGFSEHPDVDLVNHVVSKQEQALSPEAKKTVLGHLSVAEQIAKDHNHDHLTGHGEQLRRYVNSTVDTGERPHFEGYKKHLMGQWAKAIDKVKSEKAKAAKSTQRDESIAHLDANKDAFERTFAIHHHLQQATNALADNLHQTAHGGVQTEIGGKAAGGEGFVGNGLKIVNRREFSRANRERSAILKGKK